MDYLLRQGDKALGKVQLLPQGLYYLLSCRCIRPGDSIYRLTALCGGRKIPLGILAPMGDGFGLDRKIPRSHFPEGELQFQIAPSHESLEGRFVPISPREPFAYLSQLKDAHLEIRSGELGAVLPPSDPL